MALHTSPNHEIPENAIRLSKDEAIDFQRNIISKWENSKDVWFVKNGSIILASASALSGIYFLNYFRMKLRLGDRGRFVTYFPTVVIPAIAAGALHELKVKPDILIQRYTCPVCMEMKSALYHTIFGFVYPAILGPLSAFIVASSCNTYDIPSIQSDAKGVISLYRKILKPKAVITTTLFALQAFIAAFITFKENDNILTIQMKMAQSESSFDESFQ